MFKNFKLTTPISFGFGALLVVIFTVFFLVIGRIQSLSSLISQLYEHPTEVSNAVMKIEGNILRINKVIQGNVLKGRISDLDKESERMNTYEREIYRDFTIIEERFLGDIKMHRDALVKYKSWRTVLAEIVEQMRQGKRDKAEELLNSVVYSRSLMQLEESMIALYNFARNKAASFQKDAIEIRNKTLKILFAVIVIVLCVGAFFMVLLVRAEIKIRRSVEALRQSEKKFHKFFDNAPSYCYMIGPDGNILDINIAALAALGYQKEELLGKPLLTTIYAPSSIPKAEKLLNVWKETGRLDNEELNIMTKNGEERTVLLSVDAIKDSDGNLVHSISIQRDITLRKKDEDILKEHSDLLEKLVDKHTAALMKSENSLSDAQRIAHLGNWDWDIINDDLHWSDEIYRIFGLEPRQFGATYEAFLESVHPDDREFVKDSVNRALTENKPYKIDHRIVLPDGNERIVHEQAEAFRNNAGKAIRMVGTVQDITERKQIEERLRINYDLQKAVNTVLQFSLEDISMEEILNRTLDLIFSITLFKFEPRGCIFIAEENQNLLIMKAQKGLDVQAQTICERVPVGKCVCGKTAQTRELQFIDSINNCHEIAHEGVSNHGHYCVPILFSGKILGVINIFLKKGHKNELREREFLTAVANTLANIIIRKRAEVEKVKLEKQLGYEQKMKILGQLTSGVAHEVRNPLNAIIAIAEALFKDIGDNPQYQPYLDHIRKQVNRLSVLMQDLLDLGRPVLKSDLSTVSAAALIEGVITSWQQATPHKSHRIKMTDSRAANALHLMADSAKMQQVFYNLFDNACEHSPEDRGVLVAVEESEDNTIIIKVTDAGQGIAPQHLPHVFDPFFTTRKRGTGLGLSIVKNTIELHSGSIRLYNNDPPPGITAEIRLPLVDRG